MGKKKPKAPSMSEEERQAMGASMRYFDALADISRGQYDLYKSRGIPQIDKLIRQVNEYGSPGGIAEAEGAAAADVADAYGRQRRTFATTLGRYGLSPGSGKFTAAFRNLALGQAADTAGARTMARRGILDRSMEARSGLVGILSGSARNAMQGFSGAGQGLGNLAAGMRNERMQVMRNQGQASQSFWGGIAQIGAAAIPHLFSDRRLKRDIKRIGRLRNGIAVYEFTYIDEPKTLYTGVMADEVKAARPDLVGERMGYLTVDYTRLLAEAALEEAA